MARINRKFLDARLALASKLLGAPEGEYPTPGQLILQHSTCYGVAMVCNTAGGITMLGDGLTASECCEFLGGMIAAAQIGKQAARWGAEYNPPA